MTLRRSPALRAVAFIKDCILRSFWHGQIQKHESQDILWNLSHAGTASMHPSEAMAPRDLMALAFLSAMPSKGAFFMHQDLS